MKKKNTTPAARPAKLHVKRDDLVRVIAGKDKGKEGRILRILPKKMRAYVEGVNMMTKHIKRTQDQPEGAKIEQEAPIHISNLQPIDPKSGKTTRIGRRREGNQWVRFARRSGARMS